MAAKREQRKARQRTLRGKYVLISSYEKRTPPIGAPKAVHRPVSYSSLQ